ncbi:hypothetical protein PUNSTDRAFT_52324 [Punctularia strigosozonata HHB-11173 SS5]|uniref:uncharacterized protein n=1 Tax=Punctularia strigosozonata (strain HHB-11173) TaxID=741275 RepID=UPI0004417993|nr:uncharacterized protein PUNSTDRAFT_52324 [Punctularia strigosozonata HHB-11173 SS5]EIN08856.1 hypothetical protein PUNSTDRAFT_52324 [Punctularia strigosozonata HHB-11173 SS5]
MIIVGKLTLGWLQLGRACFSIDICALLKHANKTSEPDYVEPGSARVRVVSSGMARRHRDIDIRSLTASSEHLVAPR